jgi:hypothetical protein
MCRRCVLLCLSWLCVHLTVASAGAAQGTDPGMDNLVAWWKLDDGPGSTTVRTPAATAVTASSPRQRVIPRPLTRSGSLTTRAGCLCVSTGRIM